MVHRFLTGSQGRSSCKQFAALVNAGPYVFTERLGGGVVLRLADTSQTIPGTILYRDG